MLRVGSSGAKPLGALEHLGLVGGGGSRGHARRRRLRHLADHHGCGGVLRRSALDLDGAAVGDGDEGGGGDEEEEDAEARD